MESKNEKLIALLLLAAALSLGGYAASNIVTSGSVGIATDTLDEELNVNGSILERPVAPTYAGSVQDLGGVLDAAVSVVIRGKYAYVIGTSAHSLVIIDVSDPSSPAFVGNYSSSSYLNDPRDLDVVGDYAYVACHSQEELVIFDVSVPSNPVIIGTNDVGGYLHDVKVVGRYAYTANSAGELNVVDVRDPTNPVEVASVTGSGNISDMEIRGSLAYTIARDTADTLSIFNISDPNNPTLISTLTENSYFDDARSLDVVGGYAYVVSYANNSLTVVNVTDPGSPAVIASTGSENELVAAWGITVVDDIAYTTSFQDFFCAYDVSDPTSPAQIACYYDTDYLNNPGAYGFDVVGRYAYIASSGNDMLTVMDLEGMKLHAANLGNVGATNAWVSTDMEVGGQLYAHGGLAVGSGGIHVDGDMVVARHSDEGYFTVQTTGVAKTMYLTSTTKAANHNCDDNPQNCCAPGYHFCTAAEFLEGGRRIEENGTGRQSNPYNLNGDVDPVADSSSVDCTGWSSSASGNRYTCSYTTSFVCTTSVSCSLSLYRQWCCSD